MRTISGPHGAYNLDYVVKTFWHAGKQYATIDGGKSGEQDVPLNTDQILPRSTIVPVAYPLFARIYTRDEGEPRYDTSLVVGWHVLDESASRDGTWPILARAYSLADIVVIEYRTGEKLLFVIQDFSLIGEFEDEAEMEKIVVAEMMERHSNLK